MQKYFSFLKASIQKFMVYRVAFLLPIFSILLRFFMLYYLWRAAFAVRNEALGYTFDSIFSYYLFVAVAEVFIGSNIGGKISREIKIGELSFDLLRPYNYLVKAIFEELGGKLIYILYSSAGIGILFLIFQNSVNLEVNYSYIPFFIMFCILGYLINLFLGLALGSLGFWLANTGGFFSFINQPIGFLSGTYFPLDMLNLKFLTMTPFVFFRFIPAKVISGAFNFNQILFYFILAAGWILILYFIYGFVWKLGLKKYDSVGR